jgi:signal transduction histidine kinase
VRTKRSIRAIGIGATVLVGAVAILGTTGGLEDWSRLSPIDFVWAAVAVAAIWASASTALVLKGRDRITWGLMAAASFAWLIGMLVAQGIALTGGYHGEDASLADLGLLAMAPLLAAALVFFRPANDGWDMRRLLTLGIIASALTITVATVFDDLARAMNDFGLIVVVAVAYAVLYMTALTFGAYLLRGGTSGSGGRQRVLMLMVAGIGSHAVAQAWYGFSVVAGPVPDRFDRGALWLVGFGFFIWAAMEARADEAKPATGRSIVEPTSEGETFIIGGALMAVLLTGVFYRDTIAPEIMTVLSVPVGVLIVLLTMREHSTLTVERRRRKRSEAQSAVSRDAFENMVEGIAMFGPDGRMVACNSRLMEIFDLPVDVVERGTSVEEFVRLNAARGEFGQDDPDGVGRLAAIQTFPFTIDHTRPDGTVLEIRGNTVPGGGRVHTYTDVTRRKIAENRLVVAVEKAEAASKAKSEFLAVVSHELRTPLNAVIGFAEMLQHEVDGPLSPKQKTYTNDILGSGQSLLALINDVLDYSRIEAGDMDLNPEKIDLASLIETSLIPIRPKANRKRITVQIEVDRTLPDLEADPAMVSRILVILLSNAIKFTPEGGQVVISARKDLDSEVRLCVSDTGIGMTGDEIAMAFDSFAQGDSSLARQYEGLGMGLPLARSMARLQGADVALASEPGIGTTATLQIPITRAVKSIPTSGGGILSDPVA